MAAEGFQRKAALRSNDGRRDKPSLTGEQCKAPTTKKACLTDTPQTSNKKIKTNS